MSALPIPSNLENPSEGWLSLIMGLGDTKEEKLIIAWLLGCFMPNGPFPLLVLQGEQGTGKSNLASMLRSLVDPNNADKTTLPGSERDLYVQGFNNYMSAECDTRLTGDYLACPGGDCFKSPLMRNVFQKFMPCTRQISRVYGKWSHLEPYKQYRDVDTNIFWHIRVGDVMPYKPEDGFYHKLYSSLEKLLSTVLRAGRVRYYIAADWKQISNAQHVEFVKLFRSLLRKEKFQIVDASLKDILVFMLHADILIGTGSSLSGIVPLFSERPIFVNVVPKHGWHFQAESFPDSLDTVASGEIVTPVKEFQRLYWLRSRYRNNVAM